jgi:hypothetical protein
MARRDTLVSYAMSFRATNNPEKQVNSTLSQMSLPSL